MQIAQAGLSAGSEDRLSGSRTDPGDPEKLDPIGAVKIHGRLAERGFGISPFRVDVQGEVTGLPERHVFKGELVVPQKERRLIESLLPPEIFSRVVLQRGALDRGEGFKIGPCKAERPEEVRHRPEDLEIALPGAAYDELGAA